MRFLLLLAATAVAWHSPLIAVAQQKSIRSQAVIDLNFDEPSGNPVDRASRGALKDPAAFVNGLRRVDSPFWNQSGRRAVLLNGLRKQFVRLPAGPDTNRPTGVTVAFFFLNLHPLGDNQTHGIFGKRIDGGNKTSTNFGMNFIGASDSIRPYINDGSGFKYPDFSLKDTVGSRRLVYLTATFEVTDGPGNLADNKKDDVRLRFFVNGRQVKPRRGVGVVIRRNDAWATKVNVKRLLNDVPLTLGSTNETIEFTSGLIDEFTLFDRALNPKEVARLFREVAGPNAARLAAEELRPPQSPVPQITALSSHGLQIGTTSRLVVSGANLGQSPQVRLPFPGVGQTLQSGSTSVRAIIDVTVPKDVSAGMYPLRIQSEDGLSAPVPVAVDHLPQRPAAETSAMKPAKRPAAFFGEISGASRQRVYFRGRKGQRVVADVEARRLGAVMDPVLEIKTERGTPLVIAMGQVHLKRDARAQTVLPADGLYYVELHDLEFNAPGRNPFRLKIGDLKIVDAWYPPAVVGNKAAVVRPIGAGLGTDAKITLDAKRPDTEKTFLPRQRLSSTPQPMITISDAREFTEPVGNSKGMPAIDATFPSDSTQTVAVNGIIAKPGEADRFVLNVDAGRKLRLTLLGRAIDSPIDGEITVRSLPQRSVLALGQDRPQSRDPQMDVAVPAGAKQIEVTVRDLHGRGGRHYLYRMLVEPAGRPDFVLDIASARLSLPANGSGFVQLQVRRSGYNGPIKLAVDGAKSLSLLPDTIPAGRSGPVFIVVRHRGDARVGDFRHVRLVGESVGLKASVRRLARVTNRTQTVAGWEAQLPMAVGQSSPFSVEATQRPDALFKGARGRTAVNLKREAKLTRFAARLSLISTERPRLRNPKNPKLGNLPLVRGLPGQAVAANASDGALLIAVPLDVAEPEIEFVVRADLVPHPYSARIIATAFSQPFRLAVKSAAIVAVDARSQRLTGGTSGAVRGAIRRTPGFDEPIIVQLTGLPGGYQTQPAIVPEGKTEFAVRVTPPAEAKPRTLPKVTLTVTDRFGGPLLPARAVPLTISPGPAKKAAVPAKKPAGKK